MPARLALAHSRAFASLAAIIPDSGGEITASTPPASSPLYDGQAIEDMTDWATFVSAANYSSNVGTVRAQDVTITFLGDAVDAATALAEGDVADFRISVTDDQGTGPAVFDVNAQTVQYKARVVSTVDNEAEIQINPLVPDGETVSLTITGDYAGTYSFTAGDLRDEIVNFTGTTEIGYTGDSADLTAGDVLTLDEGLFTSPDGSDLTFSVQITRDGSNIAGSFPYTLLSADLGTAIRAVLTPSNDTLTGDPVTTDPVNVPAAAAGGEEPTYLGVSAVDTLSGVGTHSLDTSGLSDGDEVYVAATAIHGTDAAIRIASATVAGSAATLQANSSSDCRVQAAGFKFTYAAAMGSSVAIAITATGAQATAIASWKANGWTSTAYATGVNNGATTVSASIARDDGGYVLGLATDSGRSGSMIWDELTQAAPGVSPPIDANIDALPASLAVTTTATSALGVTHDTGLATHMGLALISLRS